MNRLTRGQCDKIAGGESMVLGEASAFDSWGGGGGGGGGFDSWGSGFDSWGGGFDSASIDFGTSVASGAASVWEGSGGFESGAGTSVWSLDAIGIEGGPMAVVRITPADAHIAPVFDNTQVASYGQGEAPWEGQYLGQWTEAPPLSYAHTAFDGALIANTGRLAGAAGAAFIEGALTGGGIGMATANPVAAIGGLVIGGLAATGAYFLLQHDHQGGRFEPEPIDGSIFP